MQPRFVGYLSSRCKYDMLLRKISKQAALPTEARRRSASSRRHRIRRFSEGTSHPASPPVRCLLVQVEGLQEGAAGSFFHFAITGGICVDTERRTGRPANITTRKSLSAICTCGFSSRGQPISILAESCTRPFGLELPSPLLLLSR